MRYPNDTLISESKPQMTINNFLNSNRHTYNDIPI